MIMINIINDIANAIMIIMCIIITNILIRFISKGFFPLWPLTVAAAIHYDVASYVRMI